MDDVAIPGRDDNDPARNRRRYHSALRRQQAAETRERIAAAGAMLVHDLPRWDWRGLTFRAVAERAGVSERTVYRYFATERALRDAVMHRLEEEAGVSYEGLELDGIAILTARVFASLPSYAVTSWGDQTPADETLEAEDRRRREALVEAITAAASNWTDDQHRQAAAVLDVLWSAPAYERLTSKWQLDAEQATGAVSWAIGLLVAAIRGDSAPKEA